MGKPEQREIGGVFCFQVLERLDDYVAGDLDPQTVDAVNVHLAGCDYCERFGGMYAGTVRDIREALGVAEAIPADVSQRLGAALSGALERDGGGA